MIAMVATMAPGILFGGGLQKSESLTDGNGLKKGKNHCDLCRRGKNEQT
jgi:hypothetical protein